MKQAQKDGLHTRVNISPLGRKSSNKQRLSNSRNVANLAKNPKIYNPTMSKDYYSILWAERNAFAEEIKRLTEKRLGVSSR